MNLMRLILIIVILCALLSPAASQGMQRSSTNKTAAASGSSDKTSNDSKLKTTSDKDKPTGPDHESIEFKLSYFESPIIEILFCGDSQNKLLALTAAGYLYRSEHHGFEWQNITKEIAKLPNHGKNPDVGLEQIIQNPVDTHVVLLMGDDGQNYVTEDCGVSIRKFETEKKFHQFQFHPMNRDWLLAATWTSCAPDDDPDDCSHYKELYVSKDLGKTWQFVEEYILQFSWGMEGVYQLFTVPEQRIIIAHITKKEGHQVHEEWVKDAEIALSDDLFKTQKTLVSGGNKFLISDHFMFVVQVVDADAEEIRLLVSDARVAAYKFSPIELPTRKKKLKEHAYSLLAWGEDRVYLHVDHEGPNSKFGTLYISDSTGMRFTKSLSNHVRAPSDESDFVKVDGLNGIYIANVYSEEAVKLARKEGWLARKSFDEIPVEKSRAKPSGKTKSGVAASRNDDEKDEEIEKNLDNHIESLITFNRGSTWQKIQPPKKDSQSNPIDCEDECSLHLVGLSSGEYPPPYSSGNSLGIILAVGNVGESLSTRHDELNTYFSRDGGLTWFEIIKGPHIYEIGDHGAIIVVAPQDKATKWVFYTWNEGMEWNKLQISETPIEISNIVIEPNNTAQQFVVLGTTTISGEKGKSEVRKGVAVAIDFSSMHERECQGYYEAFTKPEGTDYEWFTPNGKITPDCLLGVKTTYIRRKRDAQCYNPNSFEFMSNYEACACTEEDWECDFGYERDSRGLCIKSKKQNESDVNQALPPEDCKDYYYITQGYRKILGDYCVGGVDHSPIKRACPGKILTKQTVFLAVVVVIGVLAWLAFGAKIREFISKKFVKGGGGIRRNFQQMKKLPHQQGEDDEADTRIKFDESDGARRTMGTQHL